MVTVILKKSEDLETDWMIHQSAKLKSGCLSFSGHRAIEKGRAKMG